ncbi:tetratricopeptide repeat protein [Nonlabens xiamenensis]|uniref:tetratricopeptide repeat protein n=1 Tax=Nonlabens xiamenensis TaxID=2341043 RepID=UPI000F607C93|nr:tetratricopeptide repeat protein [Nonlabens xiamenensis]
MTNFFENTICWILLLGSIAFAKAQGDAQPLLQVYERSVQQAQEQAADGEFNQAEANYKKALALKENSAEAAYNLGNLYYENEKKFNAVENYKKAAENATSKKEKHKIFHNLGNSFLENKQYKEAVEAYKNALRNDPTDDETRYNLALAKQEEEKQGGGGGGGGDDQNEKDQGEGKDQDYKEGDQDEKSDGDNDGKENEKEGQDQKGDGEGEQDQEGKNTEGEDGEGDPKQNQQKAPKRVEGKMTPQQIKQILEALNNEEQKIRDKINAKKAQGAGKKSEKDW